MVSQVRQTSLLQRCASDPQPHRCMDINPVTMHLKTNACVGVCVDDGWFTQPHLAKVRPIGPSSIHTHAQSWTFAGDKILNIRFDTFFG